LGKRSAVVDQQLPARVPSFRTAADLDALIEKGGSDRALILAIDEDPEKAFMASQ